MSQSELRLADATFPPKDMGPGPIRNGLPIEGVQFPPGVYLLGLLADRHPVVDFSAMIDVTHRKLQSNLFPVGALRHRIDYLIHHLSLSGPQWGPKLEVIPTFGAVFFILLKTATRNFKMDTRDMFAQ